jgi:hypothetical protein
MGHAKNIAGLALLLAACGGSSSHAASVDLATDSGAPTEASCDLHTAYAGDDACLVPPTDPSVVQLRYGPDNYDNPAALERFILQPGQETLTYEVVGVHDAIFIAGYDVSERSGMHHLGLYNASIGVTDASSALINPALFLAQAPRESVEFGAIAPELDGAAIHLQRDAFVVAAHAINTGNAPTLVEAWINLHIVAVSSKPLSALQFAGGLGMAVPSGTKQTIKASVVAGLPIDVVQLAGHFHAHTTEERVSFNGAQVYSAKTWEEPEVAWFTSTTTPLRFAAGDSLSWECDINNTTAATLRYANQVQTAEMCNVVGFVTGQASWSVSVK